MRYWRHFFATLLPVLRHYYDTYYIRQLLRYIREIAAMMMSWLFHATYAKADGGTPPPPAELIVAMIAIRRHDAAPLWLAAGYTRDIEMLLRD